MPAIMKVYALLLVGVLVTGCGTSARRTEATKPGGYYQDDGPSATAPDVTRIPDAVPKDEPFHRFANRPYQVFGRTYTPIVSRGAWQERGTASWYGRKYHGQKTASGEVYDMYAMTAAHKTLPIPSYVRVTHVGNGRSVVVRVNDRGPFIGERIIDLSWTAASKLGLIGAGSALVDVERVFAGDVTPPSVSAPVRTPNASPAAIPTPVAASPVTLDVDGFFVQLGAFANRDNARTLLMRSSEFDALTGPWSITEFNGIHRVRAGPWATRAEAETVARQLQSRLGATAIIAPR
jgi:rare lipoprotein A